LTTKEFALLEYFVRNPNRVLTRANIGEHVWDMLFEDESNVIEVYVSRVRRKIDKDFDVQLIHTLIGTGYVLSADRGLPQMSKAESAEVGSTPAPPATVSSGGITAGSH
jgi:DNA-binding winged helix-turn-helix (wHTH) protein